MHMAEQPQRFGRHDNAFGFLRLIFASLVIASHTPEIFDGNRDRELLTRIFGTISLGELAVFGFFVISGYLITGSYINSASIGSYLTKRVARIYPAFVIASLVSLVVVAPLAGGYYPAGLLHTIAAAVTRIAILARPVAEGVFPGLHTGDRYSALNGAMWTIQYEFTCYLIVIALGIAGVLRRPLLLGLAAVLLFALGAVASSTPLTHVPRSWLYPGPPSSLPTLIAMFLSGATYYLVRHRVPIRWRWTVVAAVLLVACLSVKSLAAPGFALFGGYVILAAARFGNGTWVGRINDQTDISYGLYLYGSPVLQLVMYRTGLTSLAAIAAITWVVAALLGTASWFLVERPVMTMVQRRKRATAPAIAPATVAPDGTHGALSNQG